jgi:hypothetical protein
MVDEQRRMCAMEEDEFYPKTLQEELNEILERPFMLPLARRTFVNISCL